MGEEHTFSAEAITDSNVLIIKRSAVVRLVARDHDVAHQLWALTSRELRRAQDHIMLLVKTAQERVASFLLEMARRMPAGEAIELPMSRQDIADYLGLTIETVSRTLTHLENAAAIDLPSSRRIVLRNRTALGRLNGRADCLFLEATMTNPFVAQWWHNWKTTRTNLVALDCCGANEAGRIAHDLGICVRQLRALAGRWPDSGDLLNRRLAGLELDPAKIRRTEPQVLQDLQRVCTMCGSSRAWEHDLAKNPSDPAWREYCPNTIMLDALVTERTKPGKGA
jgi:hypothetical protein